MLDYTISSGNIFQDLGFADAEHKMAKVKLVALIDDILKKQNISEEETAKIFNLNPEQVKNLFNGHFREFSLEQLLFFLVILEQNIQIIVTPKTPELEQAKITVLC